MLRNLNSLTLPSPLEVLKKYWGYPAFRPLQEDIISSVLSGHDTLALLPTGGGKSVCFQVPGLTTNGLTIVISPLIALMKDQVEQLKKRGIPAASVNSGLSTREIDIILDNAAYGNLKFLYVSPERLKSELFLERVKKMTIGLLAIDEAHCISQWGYDFRPPYLQITDFRDKIKGVPCIALTASATPIVQKDIQEKLSFVDGKVFRKSFARDNLSYSVFYHEDKEKKVLEILRAVKGSAVVYVRNRRKTKELAEFLRKNRITAEYYHAGLSTEDRSQRQERWINNQVQVIVATNAFGMGIDKPEVRVVVNVDLPENLESYYQEAGRGGRDGRKAYAVLLYNKLDIKQLKDKIEDSYPSVEFLKKVYQCLANYLKVAAGSSLLVSYDFDFDNFVQLFNLPKRVAYNALKKLEAQGLIELNEGFYSPSKIHVGVSNHDLYKFQVENPKYDIFIKVLLRIYGGALFADYVSVNVKVVANILKTSEKQVEEYLASLARMNIFEYIEQKTKPQVIFLTPRLDAASLPINIKALNERKMLEVEKADSVIAYTLNKGKCRSVIISGYFGEETIKECGVCDVCLEKKKREEGHQNTYLEKILELLKDKSLSIEELATQVDSESPSNVVEVIREMLDLEQLVLLDNNKLCRKK